MYAVWIEGDSQDIISFVSESQETAEKWRQKYMKHFFFTEGYPSDQAAFDTHQSSRTIFVDELELNKDLTGRGIEID